jgi:hypothetical protein
VIVSGDDHAGSKGLGRHEGDVRGWMISALAILIAALLIAAIEKWVPPPANPASVQVDS